MEKICKKKYNYYIYLYLIIISLLLCLIFVEVYALHNAKLNIVGSIGYVASEKTTTLSDTWHTKESGGVLSTDGFNYEGNNVTLTKGNIYSVSFLDTLPDDISTYGKQTDALTLQSADSKAKIIAYIRGNASSTSKYDLIVYSNAHIYAPTNCVKMFSDWSFNSINFANFDTSNVTNMRLMFAYCEYVTVLDLSGFDTSNVTDMSLMFESLRYSNRNQQKLEKIIFGEKFVTSNVEGMNSMFFGRCKLETIDVSKFDTSKVKGMGYMFAYCSSMKSIDLSGFDTSSVELMRGMFENCSALTSLDLSGFDTSNVSNMWSMFWNCSNLTKLNLSSFDTSNVLDMRDMFRGCTSLSSLDLSNFDTSKVTNMSQMFSDCSNLITIYASDKWNTGIVTNSSSMFSQCSKLVGSFGTTISAIVDDNYLALAKIDGGPDAPGLFTDIAYKNASVLASTWNSATAGEGGLFDSNASLGLTKGAVNSITFTNKVPTGYTLGTGYNLATANSRYPVQVYANGNDVVIYCQGKLFAPISVIRAFSSWSNVTSIVFDNFDTSKVTSMSYMFLGCSSLTSLDVSSFNTSKVTTFQRMFYNCQKLTEIDVSNFDTSKVTSMASMFSGCQSLINLDVSNFDTSNARAIQGMFDGCQSLTSIDVTNFDTRNVGSMLGLFRGCSKLTELDLSSFDTSSITNPTLMDSIFASCTELVTIYVSDKWDFSNIEGSASLMFKDCEKLVGGMGTTIKDIGVDEDHIQFARIDGGTSAPGLFTDIKDKK